VSISWGSQSSVMSICRASSRGGEAVGYPGSTGIDDSGIGFLPLGPGTIILISAHIRLIDCRLQQSIRLGRTDYRKHTI
jgi:hypothetical protein